LFTDYADIILERALAAGIHSSIETASYISEALQLLNLDLGPSTWNVVTVTLGRWV